MSALLRGLFQFAITVVDSEGEMRQKIFQVA